MNQTATMRMMVPTNLITLHRLQQGLQLLCMCACCHRSAVKKYGWCIHEISVWGIDIESRRFILHQYGTAWEVAVLDSVSGFRKLFVVYREQSSSMGVPATSRPIIDRAIVMMAALLLWDHTRIIMTGDHEQLKFEHDFPPWTWQFQWDSMNSEASAVVPSLSTFNLEMNIEQPSSQLPSLWWTSLSLSLDFSNPQMTKKS